MAEINIIPDRVLPSLTGLTNLQEAELNELIAAPRQVSKGMTLEARIAQRYVCITGEKVKGVLVSHPKVAQTLVDAIPKIEEFFGKGTVVSLRASCDQESAPTLSANIQTTLEVSEARAARKSFNTSWWMRQSDIDELPLTFNIEYV